jgi:hypothetical protein
MAAFQVFFYGRFWVFTEAITNFFCSGLCRLLAWMAFSVTLAPLSAYRQNNSRESRSRRLP